MESDPSNIRIGDIEREDAIRKLGEHMSDGRLGVDEYGDRTARVATAKTRGELLELFDDLPDPRPHFAAAVAPRRAPAPAGRPDSRAVGQRIWAAMVPLSGIIALVLFLTVFRYWYVFLIPAVFAILGGAIFGEDWAPDRRRRGHGRRRPWD
ncbi:MAG TPA: DUF1707 domain-containing protein [Actinophytocola sp.]|uniref:DUF1707 SHOCT-like domain-containing protein n=1 Tax=Actinophytocola sp. TaxID=1872138 RepID=UPI002DBA6E52|nr:DUF1707 domain-containing protein [Actinophytocola sp.]HEU5475794.1 DUF1707 domain-containing protein [Actinophytocola sp.]